MTCRHKAGESGRSDIKCRKHGQKTRTAPFLSVKTGETIQTIPSETPMSATKLDRALPWAWDSSDLSGEGSDGPGSCGWKSLHPQN